MLIKYSYVPFILQEIRPVVEVLLGGRTASLIIRFRPSRSHYKWMVTDWTRFLTVNNSRMTVLQMLVTEKQPPLTSTQLW